MTKIKCTWLCALAIAAFSALSAPAAEAAEGEFLLSAGSSNYTASQAVLHTFTLPGGRVFSCATRTYAGSLTNGDVQMTAAPTLDGCHVVVGPTVPPEQTLFATAEVTECDYRFFDLTTAGAAGTYTAKTDISCPVGQGIHYKIFASHNALTAGTRLCEYTVNPQADLTGVHFTNNFNGTLSITFTELALQVKRTFGTAGVCGEVDFVSKFNGSSTLNVGSGTLSLGD